MNSHPDSDKTINWLLDPETPGVRYLALRDLVGLSSSDRELEEAKEMAHRAGPISRILAEMNNEGFWVNPGPGYNPKYRSTVWAVVLLAQLGAKIDKDERLEKACHYLLTHALTPQGQFSITGSPSGTIDCLQGNLCWSLKEMGCVDPRLDIAFEWLARSVTGDGIAPKQEKDAPLRYYAGKCGPGFACGANNNSPCAWGAVKIMLALGKLSHQKRSPLVERAINTGLEFLLEIDPVTADYPSGWSEKPSRNWWKFGFPVFYVTDVLQIAEALVSLGNGGDKRLENLFTLISNKKDDEDRWILEYDYAGKTWDDFGTKKLPNKWVTLRAMRVFQSVGNMGSV